MTVSMETALAQKIVLVTLFGLETHVTLVIKIKL